MPLCRAAIAPVLALVAAAASAQTTEDLVPRDAPKLMREAANVMLAPAPSGLIVKMPVITLSPTGGSAIGVMPVLVIRDEKTGRITYLHTLAMAYNSVFGFTPAYTMYWYRTPDSQLETHAAFATNTNRSLAFDYSDSQVFDRAYYFRGRAYWDRDGSMRFYGFGPESSKYDQTNYTLNTIGYVLRFGVPVDLLQRIRVFVGNGLRFDTVGDGAVPRILSVGVNFPGLENQKPIQSTYLGGSVEYDTRDSGPTTTEGTLIQAWSNYFGKSLGNPGEYEYAGLDLRKFHLVEDWFDLAGQFHLEQRWGYGIPFYEQAQVGGKESLRGFGEGRFVDRGAIWVDGELRFRMAAFKTRKVSAEFWVDPFLETGTVFHDLSGISGSKYHNVVGVAFRGVARPQVVGSLDFGYGSEGLAAFTDLGYSF
jgi:outer membrane protein assembly factor BamA